MKHEKKGFWSHPLTLKGETKIQITRQIFEAGFLFHPLKECGETFFRELDKWMKAQKINNGMNISCERVRTPHPWEDEIFFPFVSYANVRGFRTLSAIIFINYLNYVLSFIFGIGFSFCIKERTIDLILSWKNHILAGNILPFVEFSEKKFPALSSCVSCWYNFQIISLVYSPINLTSCLNFCFPLSLRGWDLSAFFFMRKAKRASTNCSMWIIKLIGE